LIIVGTVFLVSKYTAGRQNDVTMTTTTTPEATITPEPTVFVTTNEDGQLVIGNNTPRPTVSFTGSPMPTPTPLKIEWIYYTKYVQGSGEGKIYKMRQNGSEVIQVGDVSGMVISVTADWVYFSDTNLYRMHFDGSGKQQIGNDKVGDTFLSGDYIYYSNISDHNYLYRIRTDGSGRQKLSNDNATYIKVYGDNVYYCTDESKTICKIGLSGNDQVVLANNARPSGFSIDAGKLLYLDDDGNAIIIKENGIDKIVTTIKFSEMSTLFADRIYGTFDNKLFSVDINGNDRKEIRQSTPSEPVTPWGDLIYFIEGSGGGGAGVPGNVCVIKNDGTGFLKISGDEAVGFVISYF
jgi:hypothetical protein